MALTRKEIPLTKKRCYRSQRDEITLSSNNNNNITKSLHFLVKPLDSFKIAAGGVVVFVTCVPIVKRAIPSRYWRYHRISAVIIDLGAIASIFRRYHQIGGNIIDLNAISLIRWWYH
jgi:hypothetical protein